MKRCMAVIVVGGVVVLGAIAGGRQGDPPQMTELDTMAKFTQVDKSMEYKQMDFGQFKELQTQCQRHTALFPKALELAKIGWDADSNHLGRPFPADGLSPCKIELVDRLRPSDRVKPIKSSQSGGVYISKEIADRTYIVPKKWLALVNRNNESQEARTDVEKQKKADLKEAAELVMDKIRTLEDGNNAVNTRTPEEKLGAKGNNGKQVKEPTPKQ